ncbi:MAG: undecaprenyl-diphosphate phosphatase [Culicoidibacterales bacterium]
MTEIIYAIIMGIIEGITEWLPISSTGHLILAGEFFTFSYGTDFTNTFNVVIQLGAILAVVVIFFHKLNPLSPTKTTREKKYTWRLWAKVVVAVIPSAILGLLFDDWLELHFFNPVTVATMLVVYGVIMIALERRHKTPSIEDFKQLSYRKAAFIGMFQCLALIPGTSRSAATIIGATLLGTSRHIATEFSFFLAIPTMLGASALKLVKTGFDFSGMEWIVLGVGTLVSFLVSIFAIKFLLDYIRKHDFQVFGYYRIVLGIIILAFFFFSGQLF